MRDANARALAYIYSRENEAMAPSVTRGLPAFQTAGMAALGTSAKFAGGVSCSAFDG